MKNLFFIFCFFSCISVNAQCDLSLPVAKFNLGDDLAWKEPAFEDRAWKEIKTSETWNQQGFSHDGFAWYRIHFYLSDSLLQSSFLKKQLNFSMGKIDDADETYLNGKRIGKTGRSPEDPGGYASAWDTPRNYRVEVSDPLLRWGKENVLAVRVFNNEGIGGLYGGMPQIYAIDLIDDLGIETTVDESAKKKSYRIVVKNNSSADQNGTLNIRMDNTFEEKHLKTTSEKVRIRPGKEIIKSIPYQKGERIRISVSYTDANTGKNKVKETIPAYILTPERKPEPQINGAKVFGVRPGSPFLFKIPASGEKPLKYEVKNIPEGLAVNPDNGIITGKLNEEGNYEMIFAVSNKYGRAERSFTVKVGDLPALTPPMGWNSWNCWGKSVSGEKVLSSAQALIDKGLVDYGWMYVNIDDGWQAEERSDDGILRSNEKFPDMKALGEWLHEHGLKFGIYSSPGESTCAIYPGSYRFEKTDAESYAKWGVDYLKYDWCSYWDIYHAEGDQSVAAWMKPYQLMEKHLRNQSRDIVYSLCQYGQKEVWEWGAAVDGNLWRTTWDIVDSWESLSDIGFAQAPLYPFAKPGRWNDPDMLVVGQVGWGENLHPTRLTTDEQYLHISLWSLLAAPLLIGCDVARLDDFTLSLLTNPEVIAINQDPLGKQAKRVLVDDDIQCWVKELENGEKAVGIFNLSEEDKTYAISFPALGLSGVKEWRDVWRQSNLDFSKNTFKTLIPAHGVVLLKVKY
jgi:hypothetical protein